MQFWAMTARAGVSAQPLNTILFIRPSVNYSDQHNCFFNKLTERCARTNRMLGYRSTKAVPNSLISCVIERQTENSCFPNRLFACSKPEYVEYDWCAVYGGERLVTVLSLKCKTEMCREQTGRQQQSERLGRLVQI